jgi:2-polyprenyl-3-methyl-5-hydroxy-6-metoxy-1,4-benzoquinol methylase
MTSSDSHSKGREGDRERQGEPPEWLARQKAALRDAPVVGGLATPLYRASRTQGAQFLRWLIRVPVLGRLVWWTQMTVKAPRAISEMLDRLAAIQDDIEALQSRSDGHASRLDEQLVLIRRLRLDVQDLKGENPISGAVYDAFEAEFRGDAAIISQRAGVYLPIITSVSAGIPEFPILDIGCGRGEWLQLLKEHGLAARGVDSNATFAGKVRARGLDVEEAEAVQYLTAAANDSVGAVTAFHIVEHLGINALIALVREAYRVIRPGGVVILETPNPENIVVGSCSFYNDPTHRRPIPPPTLSFYLRNSGFSNVTVTSLAPLNLVEGPVSDALKPIVDRFNMGQDYAAIGYKL